MRAGILGLRSSGKSTLFKILTGSSSKEGNLTLYDERVEELSKIFNPKKTTHAYIEVHDIDDFERNIQKSSLYDVFIFVIRNGKELLDLKYKMIISDLKAIETRMENLRKKGKNEEVKILEKLKNHLENEEFLCSIKIEQNFLNDMNLITLKPFIVVYNVFEGENIENLDVDIITNLKLQEEVLSLNEEERMEFLRLYNFEEIKPKIISLLKEKLNIILFFTVGEKEVRSWIIQKGKTAKDCARKIHSDLEKGFIRAEVINYSEFISLKSMKLAKERGLVRIEGKDYIVNDGDIIYIRSSI
ncbi:MAG: DUF933 domain-containing protein [candidate division WOR-3 bacterium]|nr:DUF933 domain-containing protein [candidate division WOR-3 bacterium]MCX7947124.1 DUF933 domain-containing protein [candidate division WOR-3 bacterium]MDW8149835.1 DUF933 domain-containing protein [candidate division WOR-3 bacterium]